MLLPATYQFALFLMILSMLCWGSWANTLKLCPGYRFQLFYWDYSIGLLLATVVWGLTAGSLGQTGPSFLDAVAHTSSLAILFALCGGVVFNVANLLLVAAIEVAGLAVAFPVGIGLALVIGAVSSYLVAPAANPLLLFGGVALVTVAIVLDAGSLSQARINFEGHHNPRHRSFARRRRAHGRLVPHRDARFGQRHCSRSIRDRVLLRHRSRALHHSRQPAVDGQTP